MIRPLCMVLALTGAFFAVGCGTASRGPEGSMHQAMTGVSSSGYPAGQPTDAGSPALGSSTESKYSRDQMEEADKKEEKK